jgi:hypothetical protein
VGGAGNNTSPRNDPPPAPVLISGTFVDSPVNGIDYVGLPSGTSGVTGDTGTAGGWQVVGRWRKAIRLHLVSQI